MDIPTVPAPSVPDDAYLLDIREHAEWDAGHAPHAVHIPMGELQQRASELPNDEDVYVICRSGVRSAHVTAILNSDGPLEKGAQAKNVDGGMESWAAAGRSMISETDQEPYVA